MKTHSWTFLNGIIALTLITLLGCNSQPTTTPHPLVLPPSPTSTGAILLASPSPLSSSLTSSLTLPVLAGTPIPYPQESITPENVDKIRELAIWGQGRISQVVFSPNGELLAVGTSAGIWIYQANTLILLRFIETEQWVRALAFASDSLTVDVLLGLNLFATWDVRTGQLLHTQALEQIAQDHLLQERPRVSFSADRTTVAMLIPTGETKGWRVGLWDTTSGKLLPSPGELTQEEHIYDLALSPDGALLALTSGDTVWLWDVRQGTLVKSRPATPGPLVFSPDGHLLSNGAQVWEIEGLKQYCRLDDSVPVGATFSTDGRFIAVGIRGGLIKVWEVETCQLYHSLAGHHTNILSLAFSPDGARLVSGSLDGTLRQWDSTTGAALNTLESYWPAIRDLEISPDGSTLFISPGFNFGAPLLGFDREIYLQEVKTGQSVGLFKGGHTTDMALALSADGKTLVSSEENTGATTLIWEVESGRLQRDLGGPAGKIALSPDGRKLAIAGADSKSKCVRVINIQTDKYLYTACGGMGIEMAFSPDGVKLVLVGEGEARIFDAGTGQQLSLLKNFGYLVGKPAFSPDGQTVATATNNGIVLWNLNTQQVLHRLEAATNAPFTKPDYNATRQLLTFSPDGRLLASGVSEMHASQRVIQPTLRLWDVTQGIALYTVPDYNSNLSRLFFSPDGKLLITASLDGTVRLWGVPAT